jgi:hypothetical protein
MKKLLSLLVLVAFFGMTSCDATLATTRTKPGPNKETSKPKSPPEKTSPQNVKAAENKPEQTLKNP